MDDSEAFKLSKDGFLLLQFAPSAGVRQYNWGKKQVWFYLLTSYGPLSCNLVKTISLDLVLKDSLFSGHLFSLSK
ncbi:hypothetical protein ARALYDRAFT_899639 [Arabidopsis lyrata subsp. lyrata]|uniref:Uncharacterized protein n=1 Tax=Arabidopsis lyrata subsp. lyrata TaxID=81972 RepID=D7L115_ARALL|nr:hypothetical protein ARALYDRAFT_899639 [Arabidopsis lyrata subsp. lyrata]